MTFQEINLTDTNQLQLIDKVTNQKYVLTIFRTTYKKKLVNEIRLYTANEKEPQKYLYKTDYFLKELKTQEKRKAIKND